MSKKVKEVEDKTTAKKFNLGKVKPKEKVKWAGGQVTPTPIKEGELKEIESSMATQMTEEMMKGHREVRNLGQEVTDKQQNVSGQSQRIERAKGFSTGKSKMSAKLRFKKPIGRKSKITGVVVRGKQYKSERA